MKKSTGLLLLSLVFFLSGGAFFALGHGWIAAADIATGLVVAGFAWWRWRKGA